MTTLTSAVATAEELFAQGLVTRHRWPLRLVTPQTVHWLRTALAKTEE